MDPPRAGPRLAHVAVNEAHPALAQPREVELRSAAMEIVERGYLPIGMSRRELERQARTDEPRPPCDSTHDAPPTQRLPSHADPIGEPGSAQGAAGTPNHAVCSPSAAILQKSTNF